MTNKNKHFLVLFIAFFPLGISTIGKFFDPSITFIEAFQYWSFMTLIFGVFLYIITLITFQMFFGLKVGGSHVNSDENTSIVNGKSS